MKLAVIPARGGSKRIPHKNIAPCAGRPLMAWVLEAVRDSAVFDHIHVSTDDSAIAAVAAELGFPPDFPRPAELADDHCGVLPVVRHVAETYAARGQIAEFVALVYPTAALLRAEDLRAGAARFARDGGRLPLMSVARLPVPAQWVLKADQSGQLAPDDPDALTIRSQDLPPAWYETAGFVFMTPAQIAAGRLGPPFLGHELPADRAVDIDEPADLAWVARLLQARSLP